MEQRDGIWWSCWRREEPNSLSSLSLSIILYLFGCWNELASNSCLFSFSFSLPPSPRTRSADQGRVSVIKFTEKMGFSPRERKSDAKRGVGTVWGAKRPEENRELLIPAGQRPASSRFQLFHDAFVGMKLHTLHRSRKFLGVVFTLDLTKKKFGPTWKVFLSKEWGGTG